MNSELPGVKRPCGKCLNWIGAAWAAARASLCSLDEFSQWVGATLEQASYVPTLDATAAAVVITPLARAIYFTTQVNQQIPAPLYTAVAHVLTYVLQLKAFRQGRRRRKPMLAEDIQIPAELSDRARP